MQTIARNVATALAAGLAGAVLAITALPVAGQGQAYRPPRLADGHPDLNGIWQTINEANYDIQMHVARPALALREGPYGPVPDTPVLALGAVGAVPPGVGVVDGEIPYRPEALTTKRENQENWLSRDPEIKCYLPGVPRATYMPYPFQILQSSNQLLIAYEYAGAVRDIHLKDPGPAPVDSWMGQSVARWDGDTLVVDVTGMNDQTWFDRSGNFHSDALARGRALHAHERRRHLVRGDDRGSQGLHPSVEDEHAAVSSSGAQRAAHGFQMRGVRRGVDVRPVAQAPTEPLGAHGN